MKSKDIALYRLQAQQISRPAIDNPEQLVSHMGAIQAQDFGMCRWALGLRLPGSTEQQIQEALDSGQILRTHVLRPTWHLVSARDISWMLELSAPQLRPSVQARHRELELTPKILEKALKLIRKELEAGHKTRDELMTVLNRAKIATNDYRSGHIMFQAELEGMVCSGKAAGNKQTYALLEERAPDALKLSREQALERLAGIYFNSHGPATLQDFAWWAGLNQRDARAGLEAVQKELQSLSLEGQTYWFKDATVSKPVNSLYLLPAFDEYLISYKDRSASLSDLHPAITKNGIFHPVVVVNGQVNGLWKRTIQKDKVLISTIGLTALSQANNRLLQKAAQAYATFSGREAVLQE